MEIFNKETQVLINTQHTAVSIKQSIINGVKSGMFKSKEQGYIYFMDHVLNMKLKEDDIHRQLQDIRHLFMHIQFPETFKRTSLNKMLEKLPMLHRVFDKDGKPKINIGTFFPEILENGEPRLHAMNIASNLCYIRFTAALMIASESLKKEVGVFNV